jgi:hypothetical protein
VRKSIPATGWIAILIMIAVVGIAPEASAATFPRTMTGSFSGANAFFKWHGTVSLKAHRRQTTYEYTGKAKYTWALKKATNPSGDCIFTPASGTINEKVSVSVNRTRSGKHGYSYSGGNGAGGGTGGITRVCGDETDSGYYSEIDGAFNLGGNSKDLHKFAGSNADKPYRFKWSFFGGK